MTLQLAAAAHGIVQHRRAAQIRIQHCIQACASSLCATPALPSTMLNHVDNSSLHLQVDGQMEAFGAAERDSGRISEIRARHATQRSVAHRRESMPMGKHEVVLCEKCSSSFPYAVNVPGATLTLYGKAVIATGPVIQ